jgi:hypothetical protein
MKYWEIIADNLKKRGWSLGYVSAIDSNGGTIWIVDAHRGDGKRFVVRADEKLTAFLELEAATLERSLHKIKTNHRAGPAIWASEGFASDFERWRIVSVSVALRNDA